MVTAERVNMDNRVTGRCLCGAVKYECRSAAGPAGYCHCEDCRRCTGSAFNVSVRLAAEDFRLISGELKSFTKRGDSGTELTRHFCPECGSPIYTASPKHPNYVYVKAGTLNDPSIVHPTHQAWMRSAVPWNRIDPTLQSFDKGRT